MDHFYLGAYWGPRRESRGDCATRTVEFLQSLRELHAAFEYWMPALNAPTPSPRIDLTIQAFEELLEPHYNDLGQLIDDMGFFQAIWNDKPDSNSGSGLNVNCGAYSDHSPAVNRCVLDLPADPAALDELLAPEEVLRLTEGIVRAMEPDWAMLNSHRIRDSLDPFGSGQYVGIATYLSSRKFSLSSHPAPPSKRIDLPNRGSIILLAEDRFSVENPEHLAIAKSVTKSLRKQGIFKTMKR